MAPKIVQVPRDANSIRSYVGGYKAFRLDSLRLSPEAFASTYAREAEFSDEVWYDRLAHPRTATFFASQEDKILGTLTVLGPLPFGPEKLSPLGNPWTIVDGDDLDVQSTLAHFQINGMFTLPQMRGQGIGNTLLEEALKYATFEAVVVGREFVGSIVVDGDNIAARRLYEKHGFVAIKQEAYKGGDSVAILMKLSKAP